TGPVESGQSEPFSFYCSLPASDTSDESFVEPTIWTVGQRSVHRVSGRHTTTPRSSRTRTPPIRLTWRSIAAPSRPLPQDTSHAILVSVMRRSGALDGRTS